MSQLLGLWAESLFQENKHWLVLPQDSRARRDPGEPAALSLLGRGRDWLRAGRAGQAQSHVVMGGLEAEAWPLPGRLSACAEMLAPALVPMPWCHLQSGSTFGSGFEPTSGPLRLAGLCVRRCGAEAQIKGAVSPDFPRSVLPPRGRGWAGRKAGIPHHRPPTGNLWSQDPSESFSHLPLGALRGLPLLC